MTEHSSAELCGLKVDDVIVRINDVDITNLSHQMVHELISGFGDSFVVGVVRENEEDYIGQVSTNDFHGYDNQSPVDPRPASEMFSEISMNSAADSITGELEASKVTEEHIAEIMSGESEVLKDHNVIGYVIDSRKELNFETLNLKISFFFIFLVSISKK